jgi:hypothetical protein
MSDLKIENSFGEITFSKTENELEICIDKTNSDGICESSLIYLNETELNQLLKYLKQRP